MKIQFKWWKTIGLFLLIVGWTSLFITDDHLNYPTVAVGYCIVGIVLMYIERKPTKHNSSFIQECPHCGEKNTTTKSYYCHNCQISFP